jgi:hypothetical protein
MLLEVLVSVSGFLEILYMLIYKQSIAFTDQYCRETNLYGL